MKTWALFLGIFLLTRGLPSAAQAQIEPKAGDRFHIAGCENGELLVPVVNLWSQPTFTPRARVIGQMSGGRIGATVDRCLGSVVAALEIRVIDDRTHIKIKTIVGGTTGWITDSFVGKKFDTTRCREHFTESEHVRRCEVKPQTRPPTVAPRPAPGRRCCRICTKGKACGNSCIARNRTCRQPRGCACNGGESATACQLPPS